MTELTRETLDKSTQELIGTLTSGEMINRMRAFKDLAPEDRLAKSADILSVDALVQKGIEVPEGMRLSSRFFEEGVGTFEFGNVSTPLDPLDGFEALKKIDATFAENLKEKYPEIHKKLKFTPFDPSTTTPDNPYSSIPGETALSGCGGAGGSIAGTGGCACGGAAL